MKEARKKLKAELGKVLSTGKYSDLFFEDIFNAWQRDFISPEVVLRELRVLEGLEKSIMEIEGGEPIPIWFCSGKSVKPDTYMNRSLSATKNAIQFSSKNSPLYGLWHKHYYVHQNDFLAPNVNNEKKKHKSVNLNDMAAMMVRIAEGAVTGEWIIYERENDINTYLCLAKHKDGDKIIADRLKAAGYIK